MLSPVVGVPTGDHGPVLNATWDAVFHEYSTAKPLAGTRSERAAREKNGADMRRDFMGTWGLKLGQNKLRPSPLQQRERFAGFEKT